MTEKKIAFEKIRFRSITTYLFLKGLSGEEIFTDMIETVVYQCVSYASIKNWVAEYKRGRSDVKDDHRPGRTISVTTPENIDSVHDMILENRCIGINNIAGAL